ncbi:MAG: YlxR family protein [Chloroflexota bacterium]|nr:YlxR family protein [Chloroflexota bacterium]
MPQRTCVGCRQVRPKREMIRVVRTPDEGVQVDPTGKKPGRGAYICPRRECWEAALAKGRLEHALRTHLTPQEREALRAFRAEAEKTWSE